MPAPPKRRRAHGGSIPLLPPQIIKPSKSDSAINAYTDNINEYGGGGGVGGSNSSHQIMNGGLNITSAGGNILNNNNGGGGGGGGGGLTQKEQQQMERNAYLSGLTKDQLKNECRKRGQKTTGTKTELLQRLGFKMVNKHQQQNEATTSSTSSAGSIVTSSVTSNTMDANLNNNTVNLTRAGQNKMQQNSANSKLPSSNGVKLTTPFVKKQSAKDREKERAERSKIVLWRHPILTTKYCALEAITLLQTYGKKLLEHKISLCCFLAIGILVTVLYHVPGQHQQIFDAIRANLWFVIYWVGLGVLSSVGLGTGLHTFLLYLGPHIASVTLAAYECNSLDFPKPPYPDDIICPENVIPNFIPSLWNIMSKVRIEAFLWGAGTALGELPPYFMARAARLSGYDPDDDEEMQEYEELKKKQAEGNLNILDKAKLFMESIVERVGFMGILACASIPNPLFDLAGITCGHFLVPFWTFFGATLIGKAVIKMHIQKIFVIIAFNESLIAKAVDRLAHIPFIGKRAQEPFKSFLQNQKTKLHRSNPSQPTKSSLLANIFEKVVIVMIMYFVISIVNSLAQSYHKRIHKKTGKVFKKIAKD